MHYHKNIPFCMETGSKTPDLRTNCGKLSSIQVNPKLIYYENNKDFLQKTTCNKGIHP